MPSPTIADVIERKIAKRENLTQAEALRKVRAYIAVYELKKKDVFPSLFDLPSTPFNHELSGRSLGVRRSGRIGPPLKAKQD